MSKYHSVKTKTADGITHDSRKEANRWCELLLLQRCGAISDLQRQVKFVLIPAQTETFPRYGKRGNRLADGERIVEKECAYVADFVYTDAQGNPISFGVGKTYIAIVPDGSPFSFT